MKYEDITIEDCFVKYHTQHIICEFDGDNKEVKFMEE